MTLFIFVIIINAISIIFLLMNLMRLRTYLLRNSFDESKYTLLFGFVHIKAYIYLYAIFVLIFGTFLWVLLA